MRSDGFGLRADGVSFAFGDRTVLDNASLALPESGLLALAGPNGSGKTTLLRLLTGRIKPSSGVVSLDGRPLHAIAPRQRAQSIGVVPQRMDPRLAFTARQLVLMGRTPYTGLLRQSSAVDREASEDALRSVDALRLANRRFSELSGGEQQRVAIAMALAQDTRYLLLDEPTVHLDLRHQHELLELLTRLHRERGVAVLAVMHDLNLAALYFEALALLNAGQVVACGPCDEIVQRPDLLALFGAPLAVVRHPSADVLQVLLERDST